MKPLRDWVLVEPVESKSTSGIIVNTKTNNKAIVKAVGSGHLTNGVIVPLEVQVGDTIIYNPVNAIPYENLILIKEENIQMKV